MDKKELKQDLVRDRIIDFIQYLSDRYLYVLMVLIILIAGISGYGFLSKKKVDRLNLSSEISGLAQSEYNQGDTVFAIDDLQQILDNYESTPGGSQAYVYLIYDAYINDDTDRLESLLNNYSIHSNDLFLKSAILETKAYLSLNKDDYSSAINFLNKALKINNIDAVRIRLNIAKTRVYISNQNYTKAKNLIDELKNGQSATSRQKNIIDELGSYISHIK